MKQEIEHLRNVIRQHEYRYYVENAPIISDQEFDALMHQLIKLEAENPDYFDPNSPTQRVGSDLAQSGFEQVEHRYPMLSLGNTYSEGEIRDWYNRVCKDLGVVNDSQFSILNSQFIEVVCELKFDGTSISLWYENGELVRAVTRGDGVRGDDVTRNVRTIKNIPLKLTQNNISQLNVEFRGEILLPWKEFERLNAERERNEEPLFANPRNAASGTLKLQNSCTVAKRNLIAQIYNVQITDNFLFLTPHSSLLETHSSLLQWAKQLGLPVSDTTRVCKSIDEIMEFTDL